MKKGTRKKASTARASTTQEARISAVLVENFKSVGSHLEIQLKPLTVFVGANSSGKSTCIHSLASLSQSLKLPNNSRALTLDDEFAYVHLGRFVEAIHTRSYTDQIKLGIKLTQGAYLVPLGSAETLTYIRSHGPIAAEYAFKCTLRTQDVSVETAEYETKEGKFSVRKKGRKHFLRYQPARGQEVLVEEVVRKTAFLFERVPQAPPNPKHPGLFVSFRTIQEAVSSSLQEMLYLGPFRQPPIRRYPTRGTGPSEVGSQGESTMTMLANETVQTQKKAHIKEVSGWLTAIGLGGAIQVSRVGRSDLFEPSVTLSDGKAFPLADLGYGLSQVLPVLTQCSFAREGATLLFEQPELHLHSGSARLLASVFVETVRKRVGILIETHSRELIHGLLNEIQRNRLNTEELVIYRTDRANGELSLRQLEINKDGEILDNWLQGID